MRVVAIDVLVSLLMLLLPVLGAFFGYVIAAFLRLRSSGVFWVANSAAIVFAPAPVVTGEVVSIGPAGFLLVRGILSGSLLWGIGVAIISMVILTFVNIRISKYIKG